MHHPNVLIQCFTLAPTDASRWNQLASPNLFDNHFKNCNAVSQRTHLTHTPTILNLMKPISHSFPAVPLPRQGLISLAHPIP
jgi:hypothetical protein